MLSRRLFCWLALGACGLPQTALARMSRLDELRPAVLTHPLLQGCRAWMLVLPGRQANTGLWRNLVGQPDGTLFQFPQTSTATQGFTTVTTRPGGYGDLRFTTSPPDGQVLFPVDTLQFVGAMTLACWLYFPLTPVSSLRMVAANVGTNDRAYKVKQAASVTSVDFAWTNAIRLTTSSLGLTTWRHLVLVRAGTTGAWTPRSYLEGKLDVTGAGTSANATTTAGDQLSLGAESDDTDHATMWLDDLMLYDRALSAQEIRWLYLTSRAGHPELLRWESRTSLAALASRRVRVRRHFW